METSFKFKQIALFILILANTSHLKSFTPKPVKIKKNQDSSITIKTLYGKVNVTEQIIIDLINDPMMQRLKDIHQYGVDYYTYKAEEYDRFTHSVGVFFLARKFGAGLKEQSGSLTHDASHTPFSHLADFLFKKGDLGDSYQDDIHEQFITKTSLKSVLAKHQLKPIDIIHKNKEFRILEQDLPDICADRLEYNLYGGYIESILTKNDIKNIVDNIRFENGNWFFVSQDIARKFADVTVYLTENRWASINNLLRNTLAAQMLKRAFKLNLFTPEEFKFDIDNNIWNKLTASNDAFILETIDRLKQIEKQYTINTSDYDLLLKSKCRCVDPWVSTNSRLQRLSELDPEYKEEFERIQTLTQKGWHIKLN